MDKHDWITQSEAARLRGVSRQAIFKLIAAERIGTTTFGGRTFVRKTDVLSFKPERPGRKKR